MLLYALWLHFVTSLLFGLLVFLLFELNAHETIIRVCIVVLCPFYHFLVEDFIWGTFLNTCIAKTGIYLYVLRSIIQVVACVCAKLLFSSIQSSGLFFAPIF
jgi:hypothetical protein